MEGQREVLVLGIGNVLWADEGFGVRAVEALHEAWRFPEGVVLMDGGTLGLNLYDEVCVSRRILIFDAVDYQLPPGTLKLIRDDEVPAWGRAKLSPHQLGFNDVLGLARFQGRGPETMLVVGVQPEELNDLGGSLRPCVRARLPEAVAIAADQLAQWGFPGVPRVPGEAFEPLNDVSLRVDAYEAGRPAPDDACRIGDERILALRAALEK